MGLLKKLTFLFFAMFFLVVGQVFALTANLNISPQFEVGEIVSFDFTIFPDKTEQIDYVAAVICPNAPIPLLDLKTIDLKKDIAFTETYFYLKITEDIEPQICNASIAIIGSYELIEKKEFEIITNPSFSFNLITSKKIYLKNEDIFLDYNSEITDLNVIGSLIYPDKTTKQITLPTSIKASQIGTYELEVTASKEAYKTITQKTQFGVIEKNADIQEEILQPPLIVDSDEEDTDKEYSKNNYIFYIFILVLIGVLIFFILRKRKNKFS